MIAPHNRFVVCPSPDYAGFPRAEIPAADARSAAVFHVEWIYERLGDHRPPITVEVTDHVGAVTRWSCDWTGHRVAAKAVES